MGTHQLARGQRGWTPIVPCGQSRGPEPRAFLFLALPGGLSLVLTHNHLYARPTPEDPTLF